MIDERFFNIWYLMRYGRKKKKQEVAWLVGFFKDWCSREDLIRKARHHIELAKKGVLHHRGAYFMAETLSRTVQDPGLQYEVLSCTKEMLSKTSPEMAQDLSDANALIFSNGTDAYRAGDFKQAVKCMQILSDKGVAGAMNNLGFLYDDQFKDYNKAEKYYLMAVEQGQTSVAISIGLVYMDYLKDYDKAEYYFQIAVEHNYIQGIYYSSFLYEYKKNNPEKAEKFFLEALGRDLKSKAENFALIYAGAMDKEKIDPFFRLFKKYAKPDNETHLYAVALMALHNRLYKESAVYFNRALDLAATSMENFQHYIANYIMLLMARKQYETALNLFKKKEYRLKELLRPVYFALMSFMQDQYPKEYKRMGEELKETVDEILVKVAQFRGHDAQGT